MIKGDKISIINFYNSIFQEDYNENDLSYFNYSY